MEHVGLALLAVFILLFGMISKRLESLPITPAMVFSALGIAVGPLGFGVIEVGADEGILSALAEATLLLVLFADASTIDLRILKRSYALPLRLLGIGLPATIAFGTGVAMLLFPEWSVWQAALIAAILAPTDAALGQAVVTNERVPSRIRQALNVESGLNDGICFPFVAFFLALTTGELSRSSADWAQFAASQLLWGPLAGVAVGLIGGRAVTWAVQKRWMNHAFHQLSSLTLAFLAYSVAELVHGNGFIAAFVGGMTFGASTPKTVRDTALDFAETEGALLGLTAFALFGSVGLSTSVLSIGPQGVVYALLSLTVIRVLPVLVSLVGSRLDLASQLFLAWFGPRGLATILYVLIAVKDDRLPGRELLFGVAMCTVLLSVFAHGLTATPLAAAYGRHAARKTAAHPGWAAAVPVAEMTVRHPFRAHRRSPSATSAARRTG